jgi:hypothetical protein
MVCENGAARELPLRRIGLIVVQKPPDWVELFPYRQLVAAIIHKRNGAVGEGAGRVGTRDKKIIFRRFQAATG